jgi:hypothetical protein
MHLAKTAITSCCTYLDMMNAKTLNKSDESWAATGIEIGRPATVKKSLSRDDRINCRVLAYINVKTIDTNGLGASQFENKYREPVSLREQSITIQEKMNEIRFRNHTCMSHACRP